MNEDLIKHAYEQTIIHGSRISLYARSKLPSNFEIQYKQDALVLDDLMNFSYHIRRLLELSETKKTFLSLSVKIQSNECTSLQFWEVINRIIHNDHAEVTRTKLGDECLRIDNTYNSQDRANKKLEAVARFANRNELSNPRISIKSKDKPLFTFHLKDLIDCFEKNIIEKIIEHCSDRKIYLGSWFE